MSENTSPKKTVQAPGRRQALVLFVIAAAGLLVTGILGGLLPNPESTSATLGLNLFYYACFIGLPCFLCIKRGPGSPESLRPNPISLFSVIFIAVLAVLSVFFINDILVLWSIPFQKLGLNVNALGMEIPATRSGLIACLIYAAVLPGIFEEVLFRGVMLSAWEEQGTRRAMVVTALLFMMLHGSIIGMPGQLLLGLLIAELVICCDSIYAGLIFHTAYNAAAVLIQYMQELEGASAPVEDYFTAIGGWGGVLSLLVSILLTGVMLLFCLRTFRLRARVHGVCFRESQPRRPLSVSEKALLIAGVVLVLLLYANSFIAMLP